jgi:hypothetical protein
MGVNWIECEDTGERVIAGDYGAYLDSEHWRLWRLAYMARAVERGEMRCADCGWPRSWYELHHLHYRSLGCEAWDDVIMLCRACHARRHGREWRFDLDAGRACRVVGLSPKQVRRLKRKLARLASGQKPKKRRKKKRRRGRGRKRVRLDAEALAERRSRLERS